MENLLIAVFFFMLPSEQDYILEEFQDNSELWGDILRLDAGEPLEYNEYLSGEWTQDNRGSTTLEVLKDYVSRTEESEELWILTGFILESLGFTVRPVQGWFSGEGEGIVLWFDIWTGADWFIPGTFNNLRLAVEYPSAANVTGRYTNTGAMQTFPLGDFTEGNWKVSLQALSEGDTLVLDGVEINPFRPDSVSLGAGPLLLEVSFTHNNGRRDTWFHEVNISADSVTTVWLNEAVYDIIPLPLPE